MPSNWTIVGTGDFNGDGKSDILWRDTSGTVAIWLMNGFANVGSGGSRNGANHWSVAETGDFNGDGKSDILWRDTSGDVAIWFMNGIRVTLDRGPRRGRARLDDPRRQRRLNEAAQAPGCLN